jgi:RNA-directed DNA polymerase
LVRERFSEQWVAWRLGIPLAALRRLAFEPDDTEYHEFFIRRRGQKPRRIDNPSEQLKFVQRRIRTRLLEDLPLPAWMHGCIRGRSPLTNASVHTNQPNVGRVDVKNFFPSVANRAVYAIYRHAGFGPKLAKLLTRLTTRHGHLPQGAPTSDRLATLHLAAVAERLETIFAALDLKPSVFVDDIAFSGIRTREAFRPVIETLRSIGLYVRNGKCENAGATKAHSVTGYITNGAVGPKVSRKQRSVIRAVVHRFICACAEQREPIELELSVRGHLAHLRRTNPGEATRLNRQLLRNGIDLSGKPPKPPSRRARGTLG